MRGRPQLPLCRSGGTRRVCRSPLIPCRTFSRQGRRKLAARSTLISAAAVPLAATGRATACAGPKTPSPSLPTEGEGAGGVFGTALAPYTAKHPPPCGEGWGGKAPPSLLPLREKVPRQGRMRGRPWRRPLPPHPLPDLVPPGEKEAGRAIDAHIGRRRSPCCNGAGNRMCWPEDPLPSPPHRGGGCRRSIWHCSATTPARHPPPLWGGLGRGFFPSSGLSVPAPTSRGFGRGSPRGLCQRHSAPVRART